MNLRIYSVAICWLCTLVVVYADPLVVDLTVDTDAVRIVGQDVLDSLGNDATACDFNRDGIQDLVVGAPRADGPANARPGAGEVYVVFGKRQAWRGPMQMTDIQNIWIYGIDVNDLTGEGVACGDLNADGWADLVVAASFADGPSESRLQAGEVHILFGGPSFPNVVDLGSNPGSIVYGDIPSGRVGEQSIAVGDVNVDSTADLLLGAYQSYGKNPANELAGRAYIVFGRQSWPAVTDLRTQSSVTFYGQRVSASLGSTAAVFDVDSDGKRDAVFGSAGAGGPNYARPFCGEVLVFRGRPSWPPAIDLVVTNPDMRVYGANSLDSLAGSFQVSSGDVDGNGHIELWMGAVNGDGATNGTLDAGEVRSYEPYPGFPPTVDLASNSDAAIYGNDPADLAGAAIGVGDINGDSVDDVAFNAAGDGPDELRIDAGEISVFHGLMAFPAVFAASDNDVIVYGSDLSAGLAFRALADLNNDGLAEVVGVEHFSHGVFPPSLVLISPYDIDGDGITQLPDNCPLVANATQLDSNGDGRGDACQTDWDGDGLGDAVDCGPNKQAAGKPLDIVGVGFAQQTHDILRWQPEVHADFYDVSRGTLPRGSVNDYGACQNSRDSNRSDTQFIDVETPLSGTSFFYLVRAIDTACGGAGTWGTDAAGNNRVNNNPGACP